MSFSRALIRLGEFNIIRPAGPLMRVLESNLIFSTLLYVRCLVLLHEYARIPSLHLRYNGSLGSTGLPERTEPFI